MENAVQLGAGSNSTDAAGRGPRWLHASAVGLSLAVLVFALKSYWEYSFWPKDSDFVSFWAAARLVLMGRMELVYDISAHHAAEQAAGNVHGLLPFPYPPPFLAMVTPFGFLPFGPAYFCWILTTGLFYAWSARGLGSLAYAFVVPAVYANLITGQNGFLTAGVFILGLNLLSTRPWLAGAILGLLVIKPQMALLLPVAMLAGRQWRVITGAALSASALLLMGLIFFGWSSYEGFLSMLPYYLAWMRQSFWPWYLLASPFALARFAGVAETASLLIQGGLALGAAFLTARAWWLKLDTRMPILAAATLLITPYLFTYDTVLMIIPAMWLIRHGTHSWIIVTIWLLCLCPLLNYISWSDWPNLTPIAAAICLLVLHLDVRLFSESGDPKPNQRACAA